MKRNNKKGFTIVELTIVIAVIAILAAVLIPTFSSVVDKANQSADIQLIRQANVVLQAATADGSSLSEKDAIDELEDNSITLGTPSGSDNEFYYVQEKNSYVIWNKKTDKITYPEELATTLTNSKWTPTSEARIGNNYYATFKDAMNAANIGETIVLVKDIETSEQVTIDKKLTIDFDGHIYHIKDCSETGGFIIIAAKNATVTLNNGTIKSSGSGGDRVISISGNNNYSLEMNGMTIDMAERATGIRGLYMCYNVKAVLNDTIFNVNDKIQQAIFLDNNGSGSFDDWRHLSLTIKGDKSKVSKEIRWNGSDGSYAKLTLEGGDYSNTKIVDVQVKDGHTWKIKTVDGKKLTGMDSFTLDDSDGYYKSVVNPGSN